MFASFTRVRIELVHKAAIKYSAMRRPYAKKHGLSASFTTDLSSEFINIVALPERPPLVGDHLTKIPIGSFVSQIAISESPVSDHLP